MPDQLIRAASVGLGRWAGVIAEGVGPIPDFEIAGCFTRNEERKRAFSEKYGCRPYADYEEILADREIDAVLITTPHSAHLPQILAAARAGKHIFVEKPMTLTVAEAEEAMRASEVAGVTLMVGHCWRWLGPVQGVKLMLDEGELGHVTQAVGHFGNPGGLDFGQEIWRDDPAESPTGPFTGPGFHLLDILRFLLGPIREVAAHFESRLGKGRVFDTGAASLVFSSGVPAQASSSFITPRSYRLSIFGTEANAHLTLRPRGGDTASPALIFERSGGGAPEAVPVAEEDMIQHHMSEFANSVRTGAPPSTGGREGRELVALLEALSASAASRGWVSPA